MDGIIDSLDMSLDKLQKYVMERKPGMLERKPVHGVSKTRTRLCNFTFTFTLPTKVCLVKAMVFPVVMYGCESWTIKKA